MQRGLSVRPGDMVKKMYRSNFYSMFYQESCHFCFLFVSGFFFAKIHLRKVVAKIPYYKLYCIFILPLACCSCF